MTTLKKSKAVYSPEIRLIQIRKLIKKLNQEQKRISKLLETKNLPKGKKLRTKIKAKRETLTALSYWKNK